MNFTNFSRTATALVAGPVLFAAVSAGAEARGNTFEVSTIVSAACTVTNAGPADMRPSYAPAMNTGYGDGTVLSTFCNGTAAFVTFTDENGSGNTEFAMTDGGPTPLLYQISNGDTCTGISGDDPITEGAAIRLAPGNGSFDICAAAITTGGVNTGVPAGTYTDTVTYTLTP